MSLSIVSLGQPAAIWPLGALAALMGYTLFFSCISPLFSSKKKFFLGGLWFSIVQLIQLSWMTSIEFQGYYILFVYFLLSIWLGCQFGLLTWVVFHEVKKSVSHLLFCASFWTLMEWGRLFILCGFSWNPIGLGLTSFASSLQFGSVFGVFGLSFWVMLTNLIGFYALRLRNENDDLKCSEWKLFSNRFFFNCFILRGWVFAKGWINRQTVYWLIVGSLPYLFGWIQLSYYHSRSSSEKKSLDVALVQTDLLPSEKMPHPDRIDDFISPFEQWRSILVVLKKTQKRHWDLIVFPEAAVPLSSDFIGYPYTKVRDLFIDLFGKESEKKFPPLCSPFAQERDVDHQNMWCVSNLFWCQTLANLYQAEVIVGLDHSDRINRKNFNSVFYFKPNHFLFQRYDKQILLPLAEYLPFDSLKFLTKSYGIEDFFSRGQETKVFGNKILFSPSICYEETFSEVMREGRIQGAELFVNATNDNYYPHSSLHKQHLYHSRLRAVENGVCLVRACNSGGTAVIDCFGQILAQLENLEDTEADHRVPGVLNVHFSAFHFPTLFSFWGEGGIVGMCLIFLIYYWRMK